MKSTAKCLSIALAVGFTACSSPAPVADTLAEDQLFDIPTFFKNEIDSLTRINPQVIKTVIKDDVQEEKALTINSWETELSSFASVDLRKAAYKGFIHKDSLDNKVVYSFSNDKIDLSKVEIIYQDNQPQSILIERKVDNLLYDTAERLLYQKGEHYKVDKLQKVRLLGENKYAISGIIQ